MPKDRKRKNMLIIACIMLFAILFTPVSYTHLDVYKRQGVGHILALEQIAERR